MVPESLTRGRYAFMIADGKLCEAYENGTINNDLESCGLKKDFDWSRPVRVRVPELTTDMLLTTLMRVAGSGQSDKQKTVGEVIGVNPILKPEVGLYTLNAVDP
jgi:hypothetical protein